VLLFVSITIVIAVMVIIVATITATSYLSFVTSHFLLLTMLLLMMPLLLSSSYFNNGTLYSIPGSTGRRQWKIVNLPVIPILRGTIQFATLYQVLGTRKTCVTVGISCMHSMLHPWYQLPGTWYAVKGEVIIGVIFV